MACMALWAGRADAACSVARMAELPVTMSGTQPLVPAKINGADVMFVADSGAFYSTVSKGAADTLKLQYNVIPWLEVKGVGGETQAYSTTVKTFTLADVPLKNIEFLVSAGGVGHDAAGVLGQNVLRLADVEYDLANGVIRLMKSKDCGHANLAYWSGDKPFSIMDIDSTDTRTPHTIGAAYVNGVRIRVLFDTGASTSILSLRAAARAGVKPGDDGVKATGLTYGFGPHPVKTWIAPVSSFKVGDEEIRSTKLQIGEIDLENTDMLLGADFFLSHRIYVSNAERKLYFTYNGGPVFNLNGQAMVQAAPDQAPKASPALDEGREAPKVAEDFSRRGAAFEARGDLERAMADFDQACILGSTEAKYFIQRALARLRAGKTAPATADLDQALKLEPNSLDALALRAELRLSQKDKVGAAADLDAIARLAPSHADIRLQIAQIYERADMLDAALGQYDIWIQTHDEDGRMSIALNSRCWIKALQGRDLDAALGDCNRAARLSPKTANVLDSRGLVRLRRGEFEKAVSDYDAALAIRPNIAWSLYGRGLAKLGLGAKAEGEADIAAARALAPNLPDRAKGYGVVAPAPPQPAVKSSR